MTASIDPGAVTLRCVVCGTERALPLPLEANTPELRQMAVRIAKAFMRTCEPCLAAEEAKRADVLERTALQRRLADCGVPVTLMQRLSDLEAHTGQREAFATAHRWAAEGGYLFLYGDVGRGKSTIAAAALVDALDHRDGLWVAAPKLLQLAAADFGTEEHRQAQRIFASRQALVLDDLGHGSGAASDSVRNQFHAAINERIVTRTPLLITSNKRPSQLAELYGDWLGSRLAGEFTQVIVAGPDNRLI